ncbi:MAG: hypothetical protein ABSF18_01795 [Gammaproteobacteria bacterium]|jgi:hypothetical protein
MTYLKRALLVLMTLGSSYAVMATEQAAANDTVVLACDVSKNLLVTISSSFNYNAGSKTCSVILSELQDLDFTFKTEPVATSNAIVYTMIYSPQSSTL